MFSFLFITGLLTFIFPCNGELQDLKTCVNVDKNSIEPNLLALTKSVIPPLNGKKKGDAGKIGIIGGSAEYTGAPYFAAITALKVGADLVYVFTTESAAPIIKAYSPDLIVYPLLHPKNKYKIRNLLTKLDTVVVGPGLGREDDVLNLIYDIILTCKRLEKPLVIDADGLYAISKNVSVIQDYPFPGVILTPNHHEVDRIKEAIAVHKVVNDSEWYHYWGSYVTVLVKGQRDTYYSSIPNLQWELERFGSGRRAGGQGDILAGTLGTFYNWALKSNTSICEDSSKYPAQLAQTVAAYAAAAFTRVCNFKAYELFGRSMTASDMLSQIHFSFESLFGN